MTEAQMIDRLHEALNDSSDVYVNEGIDEAEYLKELADDLLSHVCTPIFVTGKVFQPGFPDTEVGANISGWCLANNASTWLVYEPEKDRFYGLWGSNQSTLSAHGVFGSPLYCWSA